MRDPQDQLRAYGEMLEDVAPQIPTAELTTTSSILRNSGRRVSRSRVWIGLAAAAVTALVVGLIPWLADRQPAPIAATTTTVSSATTTLGAPTTTLGSSTTTATGVTSTTLPEACLETPPITPVFDQVQAGTWARVELDEGFHGGEDFSFTRDMAAGASAVVVSGQTGDSESIWVSTDPSGLGWSLLDGALGAGDIRVGSITAYGDGFVAVGTEDDARAAVWVSADGTEWRRIPDQPSFSDVPWIWMQAVASNNDQLVAVGKHEADGHLRAAAWTSTDGETWTRLDGPFHGDPAHLQQQMEGVITTANGYIAFGWEAENWSGIRAAIWTSEDGTTWTRATICGTIRHGDPGEWGIRNIAAVGDRLVAISGEGRVHISNNGNIWHTYELDQEHLTDVRPGDIVATDFGFIMVGTRNGSDNRNQTAAMFISADGINWTEETPNTALGTSIRRLAATGDDTIIGIGFQSEPAGMGLAAIWTRQ